jgi:flagellar protein FliL
MAKDAKAAESAVAPKSNKMLIIIVALVVLVLALGGGAAFLLMGGKSKKHGDKEQSQETVADDAQGKPTPMVTVGDKFTVNLQSDDGSTHFLQVPKIELEMASDASAKKVEERKDKISDRINSTLRSKSMKEMMEPGSDLKLKEELKTVINSTLEVKPEDAPKSGVIEVIFPASFIVQ